MASEVNSVVSFRARSMKNVVSERTQAFARTKSQRIGRKNAVNNIAARAQALREEYGEANYERINRAARNMVSRLLGW